MLIAPSLNFVLAGIGGKDVGSASGVLTTVQQIGGALGVAAIIWPTAASVAERIASHRRAVLPGEEKLPVAGFGGEVAVAHDMENLRLPGAQG